MSGLAEKVSSLIETQFPAFYRDEGEKFIAFTKAYYEWLEETNNVLYNTKKLTEYRDIDKTIDDFLIHFKNKYLVDFPLTSSTDIRSVVKKSLDIYRAKGSEAAIQLVLRLLFNEESTIYHPGDDVIKPSDGVYVVPRYVELSANENTKSFRGKEIVGIQSGAKAFVDYVARRQYNGFIIDQAFLSNIRGNFVYGETVTANGTVEGNPVVIGSLTSLEVVTEGADFTVGEEVKILSDVRGRDGRARITEVGSATGQLNYVINDGGFGYVRRVRNNVGTIVEPGSNVYISTVMFGASNTTNRVLKSIDVSVDVANTSDFIRIADSVTFNALSAVSNTGNYISIASNQFDYGDVLTYTVDPSNTPVSGLANNGSYHVVFSNSTAIALSATPGGANIDLTAGSSETGHTLSKPTNVFANGDTVIYFTSRSNTAITGLSNNTTYYVVNANNIGIQLANTANGTALGLTSAGSSETHYIYGPINRNLGNFQLLEPIVQYKTFYTNDPAALWGAGQPAVGSLVIGSNATHDIANGYIVASPNTVSVIITADSNNFNLSQITSLRSSNSSGSNTFANTWTKTNYNTFGVFTRANNEYIGFHSISGNGTFVYYVANTDVQNNFVVGLTSNTVTQLGRKYLGSGASFVVGQASPVDRIYVETDLVGGNNDVGVPYLTLALNAAQYDFPKFTAGDLNTVIDRCLDGTTINVGSISLLAEVNPGEDYNISPFITINEPRISGYNRKDLILNVANITKPFLQGERLTLSSGSISSIAVVNGGTGYTNGDAVVFSSSPGLGAYAFVNTHANGTVSSINVVSGGYGYDSGVVAQMNTGVVSFTVTLTTNTSIIGEVRSFTHDTVGNTGVIDMKRLKFNMPLSNGVAVSGFTTEAVANVISFTNKDSESIGLNANVISNTSIANGIVSGLAVIDSGIGYVQDEIVTITSDDPERDIATARVNVLNQGKGTGIFKNTQGFLNADKYIHDGSYYQEYSYEVRTGISLDKYAAVLKQVLHVAGTKYFGNVIKVITDIKETAQVSQTDVAITKHFYSNSTSINAATDVINIGNNTFANTSYIFGNNDTCVYVRSGSANIGLVNNNVYYVLDPSNTGFKLQHANGVTVDLVTSGNETGHSLTRFE